MDIQSIHQYKSSFDAIASYIEGEGRKEQVEIWFARDLMSQLGYSRWENPQTAIIRAVDSCNSLDVNVDDRFHRVIFKVKCQWYGYFRMFLNGK